ncbi:MAG: hypothetical protein V4713_18210 [Pseudomonadota bacterium]
MKRVRHTWKQLQASSYFGQLSLIAGMYLLFYGLLFVLVSHFTWGFSGLPGLTDRAIKITSFLFLDSGGATDVNSVWSAINKLGVLMLTAFSSSLLTSKMISHQSKLRFSTPLAYYSRAIIDSEQSQFPGEYLVFRLLNDNEDDLYNVKISATLRYFHAPTRTFQHYTCRVTNGSLPVLGTQMPFRIYIEMSEIVSAIYKKRLCFHPEGGTTISIAEIQSEIAAGTRPPDADQFILYLEGIDSGEGKLTTSSHRYDLGKIQEGKFKSIDPREGQAGFDPKDIKKLFNEVAPLDGKS